MLMPGRVVNLFGIFILVQFATSCSKYSAIKNSPAAISKEIKLGTKVKIRTRLNKVYYLKATKITDTHIHGVLLSYGGAEETSESERLSVVKIAFSDIEYIEKGKFSAVKTGAATAGTAYLLFMFAVGFSVLFLIL